MMLKDHGPLCMHRLGDWVGVAKGSFTQVVDKLVEENLAKRERSHEDRRVVILSITKKGREVSRTIDEHFSRHLNEVLRVLNDEEKAAMLDALRTVERTTRIIQERWNAGR
jgi:DNA-binding MarR family transcriptional regulator